MISEKFEIISIINNFRRLTKTHETLLTNLKKSLRSHEKIVASDFKNDTEYLQDRIDYLNNLFESYTQKKRNEIETIKCLFDNNDEDYDLYPIDNQQYQSFSDKILLPFNEYLEKSRPKWIEIMTEYCNDTTDIDDIFSQLIKKHEELPESLKDVGLISEGIESIIYNFTITNTLKLLNG